MPSLPKTPIKGLAARNAARAGQVFVQNKYALKHSKYSRKSKHAGPPISTPSRRKSIDRAGILSRYLDMLKDGRDTVENIANDFGVHRTYPSKLLAKICSWRRSASTSPKKKTGRHKVYGQQHDAIIENCVSVARAKQKVASPETIMLAGCRKSNGLMHSTRRGGRRRVSTLRSCAPFGS